MDWNIPVDVNYYEAKAYCAWKSQQDSLLDTDRAYRLITEAEHNLIRPSWARLENVAETPQHDRSLWSEEEHHNFDVAPTEANYNLACGSSVPVDSLAPSPNLLCRVPDPLRCLDGLAACTNPGGVVVLSTPFSWLEEYTSKENWLGGFIGPDGKPVYSKNRLKVEMEARGFTKIHEEQMPALIREHQRKYQYIVSEASGWRMKE